MLCRIVRQEYSKGRTGLRPGINRYPAVLPIDSLADNSQTDTGTFIFTAGVQSAEWFEYLGGEFGIEANPVIRDRD